MEVKLLEKGNESIKFLVAGINTSIANAMRRSVQEIPVLAIDIVEFIKNDSALYDEILAHRLGLLPIKTDKTLTLQEECSCKGKGCNKCTVSFKLKAEGPCIVYASELKGKSDVIYKDMPIVILAQNQQLELNAYSRLGKGVEHAKFSPGLVSYTPEPIISVNNKSPKFNEFKDKYPPQIFKDREIVKELIKDELVDACDGVCDEVVKIEYNDENFIFYIESSGQISAREIFMEACKALEGNLKQLSKAVDKI